MLLAVFESPVASEIHNRYAFYAKPAVEKTLGLHYRRFQILTPVFTRLCEPSPPKNWQLSRRVEKVGLALNDFLANRLTMANRLTS
jgi:hypothetical protein